MAVSIQVSGAVLVKVGPQGCADNNLAALGYTANGVRIQEEDFFEEVHSDERGGEAGPPVELVYHGKRVRVTLELVKWDAAVADQLAARLGVTTPEPGKQYDAGIVMIGGTKAFRLVLKAAVGSWDLPVAIVRGQFEINKGSRASRLLMAFECYPDANGYIYKPYNGP
ncbi:MAG TPA: hypothetical protein PK349_11545 [Candidatus Hydrogenedentes bacterium]|nr:hypothetical protein [Candidatus Hydrogenedentota bacterium]